MLKFVYALAILAVSFSVEAAQLKPFFLNSPEGLNKSYSRSLCGTNDMVPMVDANSLLKEMGSPIGIYEGKVNGSTGYCTGTLITKDLFLTAKHCAAKCEDIKITFGYLEEQREESFNCKELIEEGGEDYDSDYFIIRLEGNPGVKWGWYDVSSKAVPAGSELLMIHHPKATPMKVSQKNCKLKMEEGNFLTHRCDTEPGSSGAAILLPNYENPELTRIVGVHTLGGCDSDEESTNSGPSMRHLAEISTTLKALAR